MGTDDQMNFCTRCGAALHESDTFCIECGNSIDGYGMNGHRTTIDYPERNINTLTVSGILCGIWAFLALYIGLSVIFNLTAAIDGVILAEPDAWAELMEGITRESFENILVGIGYVFIISGAMSAVTMVLCLWKKHYKVALVCCIISSLTALFFGVIGLVVAYLIYTNRDGFDQPADVR